MYKVFVDEVILGALKRNSPSHSCWITELSVVVDGRDRRWVCVVQTGQVDFCS